MPAYDFLCSNCSYEEEINIKLKDKEKFEKICPKCKTKMTQRVAKMKFVLKGSGWFSDGSGFNSNGTGYEITENEKRKNLEQSARMEDNYNSNL